MKETDIEYVSNEPLSGALARINDRSDAGVTQENSVSGHADHINWGDANGHSNGYLP